MVLDPGAAAMIIHVSDIPDEGLRLDTSAVGQPFSDASWRLEELSLLLERDEADVVVTGHVHAVVPQTCGRCLEPMPVEVHAPIDVRVVPRPSAADAIELGADDLDTDFYTGDELDVTALIETETTLALPMKPLCREDCRGLCPVCGGNRNVVACRCEERSPDPRLAVLKDLAARLPKHD